MFVFVELYQWWLVYWYNLINLGDKKVDYVVVSLGLVF